MKGNESDLQRIVIGRFDRVIRFIDVGNPQRVKPIRIGSTKQSDVPFFNFEPIGTDGEYILYRGERYPSRDWFSTLDRNTASRLIVLTLKERDLLIDILVDSDCDIHVFEIKYPIFKKIHYVSNMEENYSVLIRMLTKVRKIGLRGRGIGDGVSADFLYRVERKLRFKNGFDSFFALASQSPYQEVFRLKEERPDRVIIAFDFNSMYASCMRGHFLEPRAIRYADFRGKKAKLENLIHGLYRVILRHPNPGFFRYSHPFRYAVSNKQFHFELDDCHEIETLLFRNEIEAYAGYFGELEVLEGFVSKSTITHPLLRNAESIYRERQHYKVQSSEIMEALCKFRLATMHSATNQRRYVSRHFQTSKELIEWLEQQGFIEFPAKLSVDEKLRIALDYRFCRIRQTKIGFTARMIRFDSPDNVFSLSAQIIATSKVNMLRTLERFIAHPSVELCYCNVDSIHISLQRSEVDLFLENHQDIISGRMGDLKIQAITDKGYWFDIGRYWLIKANEVAQFKNRVFNYKGNQDPFTRFRKVNLLRKGDLFSYMKPLHFTIMKSFSYTKKIHEGSSVGATDYCRYSYDEIKSLDIARDSFDREILRSQRLKIDLFEKISIKSVTEINAPHARF